MKPNGFNSYTTDITAIDKRKVLPKNYFDNQLVLYGSVVGGNTAGGAWIGGNVTSYMCPLFIQRVLCNEKIAMKYDIHFIRNFNYTVDVATADNHRAYDPRTLNNSVADSYLNDGSNNINDIFSNIYYINTDLVPSVLFTNNVNPNVN